jgi:hypothetical protein
MPALWRGDGVGEGILALRRLPVQTGLLLSREYESTGTR